MSVCLCVCVFVCLYVYVCVCISVKVMVDRLMDFLGNAILQTSINSY